MSDDKKGAGVPLEQGGTDADERIAALRRAIREEMDTLTPEELERLYATIALMQDEQGE